MKVLLVRPKPQNIFARLKTVRFEPLELEYLAQVVNQLEHSYQIYDGVIAKNSFENYLRKYKPDVVAITGYTIHVNLIKEYAKTIKEYNQQITVVVGGIHAELNWQDFYTPHIDMIVYANPVVTFKNILKTLELKQDLANLQNICFKNEGNWLQNCFQPLDPDELPLPDRTHLLKHKEQFTYFGKEQCALVKTAWGCCYDCNFCYCARLNNGGYAARKIEQVIEEIEQIPQKKIFIIDDDFLVDRKRLIDFCSLVEGKAIKKDFSIYGRADLICKNADLLPKLKEAGISEIIVGLESVDDQTLKNYNKQVNVQTNLRSVELLRKYGIKSCGLFIVNEDYDKRDFTRLSKVVGKMQLDLCMFSIFTPLKGVPGYENYQDKLRVPEDKYENTDFLHLNIQPANLSVSRFYYEFYKLYVLAYLNPKRLQANFKPLVQSVINLVVKG